MRIGKIERNHISLHESGSQKTGFLFLVACFSLHVGIDFVGTKPNTKGFPAQVNSLLVQCCPKNEKFPFYFIFQNQTKLNFIHFFTVGQTWEQKLCLLSVE